MTRRSNSGEVPAGHPHRRPLVARAAVTLLAVALPAIALAGCGGGDAPGAQVSVYVAAPLCGAAKDALASHGSRVGNFTVAVRCLAPGERDGERVDLAANGASSRRATEDTSAVALLEPPGPGNEFSRPILESAGIPLVVSPSGGGGMRRILGAVEAAGSSGVRESVDAALDPS